MAGVPTAMTLLHDLKTKFFYIMTSQRDDTMHIQRRATLEYVKGIDATRYIAPCICHTIQHIHGNDVIPLREVWYFLWLLLCLIITGLDYETQKSYSLTFEARDGGGRVSTANLFLEVEDVNDNAPVFEQKEYSRTVREGATSFQPQLFVRVSLHFSDVTDLLMHCDFCLVSNSLANHKINNIYFILFLKAKSFCQLYKHLYV